MLRYNSVTLRDLNCTNENGSYAQIQYCRDYEDDPFEAGCPLAFVHRADRFIPGFYSDALVTLSFQFKPSPSGMCLPGP